ncbi:hypothetical protein HG536_0E02500 [Torulaspora globosa]|uniref:prephenate dehydratase n=1 Tax=Torulaspora globosa TaxID=48254 RepID=A0A7G3ZIK3_9SACH|nr:uncharacterized protein HG536_0E02500 [Torulaspora globosa]QLL33339.1 hypothetical protein HG536_0E02500 [Torulaspora globosa]
MTVANSATPIAALFLGPEGTYSHQAALQQFGDHPQAKFIVADSIPECLERLENDSNIDFAAVPFENSTNGQVVFTYDLLRDRMAKQSDGGDGLNRVIPELEVIDEQYVSVSHCLVASSPLNLESLPRYKRIRIYSHPQVWGQVDKYLQKLKNRCPQTVVERIDTPSTSEAVRRTVQVESQSGERSELNLAIASNAAAKVHNAHIIDQGINDKQGNTTRFLIFRKRSATTVQLPDSRTKVSLLTFTIKQDNPRSLVDVLAVLKNHPVNMCSISSRPLKEEPKGRKWQYIFFIEYYCDSNKIDWDAFYQEISASCSLWCLWGTFPRNELYSS